MKARKVFEGNLSQLQRVGCTWASTGHLPAGATKGLVTKGNSVHGSSRRLLATFSKQAQSCIFCLLQLSLFSVLSLVVKAALQVGNITGLKDSGENGSTICFLLKLN